MKKFALFLLSCCAFCLLYGCAAGLTAPLDWSNFYYEYSMVSTSDEKYIILTKHLVSESDVHIPDTIYDIPVKGIGESTFADDERIVSVTFGKYVESVGLHAFGGCTSLQTVQMSVSTSDIGAYAFQDCTSLTAISLDEHITSIGRGAFSGCTSLKEVALPQSIADIGGRAFADTPWLKAQSEKEFVTVGDGVLIAYNGGEEAITLPKRVKHIAGAFAGNTRIVSVRLTTNVQSVGDMAFMGCTSLKSVNLPKSVTRIGAGAFFGCSSLGSLYLGEEITAIGEDAFAHCTADLYVTEHSLAEAYCIENGIMKGN